MKDPLGRVAHAVSELSSALLDMGLAPPKMITFERGTLSQLRAAAEKNGTMFMVNVLKEDRAPSIMGVPVEER